MTRPTSITRRVRRAFVLAVAAAVLAAPGTALAADPPTILTAGIDVDDQLYATWSLAPGTTFDRVGFATVPTVSSPGFFDIRHFAGFECADDFCDGKPTSTSHTAGYPTARDRRYFVMVTAAAAGEETVSSAVWVIDDTKPVIPGVAPLGGLESTNVPVAGHPFDGASLLPPGVVSTGKVEVLKVPKTNHGLLVAGVRLRVTCSAACGFEAGISLGDTDLALKETGFASGVSRTFTLKPSGAARDRIRRRARSRIKISAAVTPLQGRARSVSRFFTVRR